MNGFSVFRQATLARIYPIAQSCALSIRVKGGSNEQEGRQSMQNTWAVSIWGL